MAYYLEILASSLVQFIAYELEGEKGSQKLKAETRRILKATGLVQYGEVAGNYLDINRMIAVYDPKWDQDIFHDDQYVMWLNTKIEKLFQEFIKKPVNRINQQYRVIVGLLWRRHAYLSGQDQ